MHLRARALRQSATDIERAAALLKNGIIFPVENLLRKP